MVATKLSLLGGVAHRVPQDVRTFLSTQSQVALVWNSLTPLARNEWLCWIESAKQHETRTRRMTRMKDDLRKGKRRPCCWAGCPHR